eukprot:Hpha_TRINITY_DN15954_c1_g6::TRINITY_DN15954_c1_g6_i1::g.75581::m.75581/K00020/mmsB, HIBADH; 3-hydroxyisobutyrate dehydrogenase
MMLAVQQRRCRVVAMVVGRRCLSTVPPPGKRVAVVGAGQIGAACARGLLRNGYQVRVHDPNEANRGDLEGHGATWVSKVEDLLDGENHDVLVTALPAPPHVKKVMEEVGLLQGLRGGSYWIDHTTTHPNEAVRLHGLAKDRGVHSLEAPLTGGYELLCAGMMTVLVGGDPKILEQSRSLIKSYTETVLHMGDLGTASHVKIITNQLAAVHLIAAGEAVMMAKKGGVNLEAFFDGVRASAGNSYVFETEVPLMFNQTFEPGFAIELHVKDLRIGRDIHSNRPGCKGYDKDYRMNALAEQMYVECMDKYGPRVGSSSPAKVVQEDTEDTMAIPGYENWKYTIEKVKGGSIGVVHKNRPSTA